MWTIVLHRGPQFCTTRLIPFYFHFGYLIALEKWWNVLKVIVFLITEVEKNTVENTLICDKKPPLILLALY